jgi:hypothetical protein
MGSKGFRTATHYASKKKKGWLCCEIIQFDMPLIVAGVVVIKFALLFNSTSYNKQWKRPSASDISTNLRRILNFMNWRSLSYPCSLDSNRNSICDLCTQKFTGFSKYLLITHLNS